MDFKTFNTEDSPSSQGFVEESYDLVIAANVLHITDNLDNMMTNVRQLLKPGGYLMVFEVISNDALRIGLAMGGLPGWCKQHFSEPNSLSRWFSQVPRHRFGSLNPLKRSSLAL